MRGIRIITAGPHASVQDGGRAGHQWLGIPAGGVLDRDAYLLGNALVGNPPVGSPPVGPPPNAAVIEICLGGFTAELLATVRIALTGTDTGTLTIIDKTQGQTLTVEANRSIDVPAGRIISLTNLGDSNSAILAFSGGIETPLFYGSRATSPSAKIGGIDGGFLADGMVLPLGEPSIEATSASEWHITDPTPPNTNSEAQIRCVRGPQDHLFTPQALHDFFNAPYQLTPMISRMGMRLAGTKLTHKNGADIASDGIVTGSVQVPASGMPIILLADHQSTGGYTKIATVISADLPRLARLKPKSLLRFEEVTVIEAESIARQHHQRLMAAIANRQPAKPLIDLASLYRNIV